MANKANRERNKRHKLLREKYDNIPERDKRYQAAVERITSDPKYQRDMQACRDAENITTKDLMVTITVRA